MDVSTLTADQVRTVCSLGESHFHDRKSARFKPAKLTKAMSAFANADGGELVIGVENDGTWVGRPSIEDFNGHLQALEGLFPYGAEFNYEFLQHPDGGSFVLQITIQKSRDIKFAAHGKAYVRRGAQCLEVQSIDDLRRKKGLTTHEAATLRYGAHEITNSETIIKFMLSVVPDSEPERWLRKQNVIVERLPTVAGTVLFHDEPQVHLPKSGIKVYRYTTAEQEGTRAQLAYHPMSIEGPAYDVIYKAVSETARQVEDIPVLEIESGLTRSLIRARPCTRSSPTRSSTATTPSTTTFMCGSSRIASRYRALEICRRMSRRRTFWTNGSRGTR